MSQGKRKEQEEFSMMMFVGALVGMVGILLFSLVAVVVVEVWSWLCG
jgi:Tfp pilus assembly protein PilN